jgi:Bacteriophage tail sheath protein
LTPSTLGLQVQEERGPEDTIARLGTARTAFVGRTLRGPVSRPILLKNFAEFQHTFGGLWQPSPLGYAVEHFFDNGGREALVVRVVNGARAATLTLNAGNDCLTLRALSPGTREFLRASVDYDNTPADDPARFNLTVQRVRLQGGSHVEDQEIFPNLSMTPGDERYLALILAQSELIQLVGDLPVRRPDCTLDATGARTAAYVSSNSDGDDGAPLTDYDLIGSEIGRTGLFALQNADYFNFLCIPPLSRVQDVGPSALLVGAKYCKERRALLIIDPPSAWHTADDALRALRDWDFSTENALMYFPRIFAHDKLRGHFESFAPCGAIAGMLARTDETSPVWGTAKPDEAVLRPGYRPTCLVAEDRRVRLLQRGVNTLQAVRSVARIGVKPRTLAAGAAGAQEWQSLAARRLALFIVNSIERGTRWVVAVEPSADVANAVATQVRNFFVQIYEAGAFAARRLEEAFFVICDQRINAPDAPPGAPQDARPDAADGKDSRGFQFLIGFAATRRMEFHSFRISHSASGSLVRPVSLNRSNLAEYSPEELDWVDKLASQLEPP